MKRDATEGSNGGAEGTAWEALLDMETYNYDVEEMDHGAVTLVVGLDKAFQEVQQNVVWAWAMHLGFPQRVLRILCGYFQHQRRVIFEGSVADPLQTITAILPGSRWICLLLRVVLQDALGEVLKVYPPLKPKALLDDIKLYLWRVNQEVPRAVPKVVGKLKDEIRETKLQLSLTEEGKEGKSKLIASNMYLKLKLLEWCKDEGIGTFDSVEYLGQESDEKVWNKE